MTIQTAVENAAKYAKYAKAATANVEWLEGYLALTDCILSTIKGRAFVTKSTEVMKNNNNILKAIMSYPCMHVCSGLLIGYKDNRKD